MPLTFHCDCGKSFKVVGERGLETVACPACGKRLPVESGNWSIDWSEGESSPKRSAFRFVEYGVAGCLLMVILLVAMAVATGLNCNPT